MQTARWRNRAVSFVTDPVTGKSYPIPAGGADTVETINALMARLDSESEPLTDEELAELQTLLDAEFDAVDGDDPDVERMEEIVAQADKVREVQAARETARTEAQTKAEELRAKMRPVAAAEGEGDDAPEGEEEEPAPEGEGDEAPAEGDEPATDAEAEAEPEPIAASVTPLADAARHRPPAARPRPKAAATTAVIASGDVPHMSAGGRFADRVAVGKAFADKVTAVTAGGRGRGGAFPIASIVPEWPDALQLTGDKHSDMAKINAVLDPLRSLAAAGFNDAVIASGGICAPPTPRYELFGVGDSRRPIRDALPRFNAARGGITYPRPPKLSEVSGAVDNITAANDAAGGAAATKNILTIDCGTDVEVSIEAFSMRARIGNFNKVTFPEWFSRHWDLIEISHARTAEGRLWDLMVADANTIAVTTGEVLGAARDILENLDQAAAQHRSRHRMARTAVFDVILPDWVINLMSADLLRQLPGDNTYAVTEAQVTSWLRARNLNPVWTPDAGQEYADQGVNAALLGWQGSVEALLYPPGHFIHLDGGALNLGTEIRDSTLNATNDVEAFAETFESVAALGIEALHLTMNVCPDGSSSGTVDISPCSTGS